MRSDAVLSSSTNADVRFHTSWFSGWAVYCLIHGCVFVGLDISNCSIGFWPCKVRMHSFVCFWSPGCQIIFRCHIGTYKNAQVSFARSFLQVGRL